LLVYFRPGEVVVLSMFTDLDVGMVR